jgi:hypothetical protein
MGLGRQTGQPDDQLSSRQRAAFTMNAISIVEACRGGAPSHIKVHDLSRVTGLMHP